MAYKIPVSVLVVVYTPDLDVLLLERADRRGFWQSVTGSQDEGETLRETAVRELREETGLDAARYELADWRKQNRYEIYRRWRSRYAPGVTHNVEHVFGLRVPHQLEVALQPREHLRHEWLPWQAAAEKVFSWSNAEAIREVPERAWQASQSASLAAWEGSCAAGTPGPNSRCPSSQRTLRSGVKIAQRGTGRRLHSQGATDSITWCAGS